jgi:modulator of FtsH protease
MGLVAVTAGLFRARRVPRPRRLVRLGLVSFIAAFGVLLALNVAAQRSEGLAVTLLFGFGVLTGVALAPTLAYYADTNPQVLWQAGGATRCSSPGSGRSATRRGATCRRSPASLLGPDRADRVRNRADLRPDPERPIDLRDSRPRDLRRADGVRLPAAAARAGHPYGAAAAASIFLDVLNVFTLFLSLFGRN